MTYVEYLNSLIRSEVLRNDNVVLFGQNINAGSYLGGLTKNIKVNLQSRIINSTNAENSLTGFGFGLMMNGASGVFLLKQLDFLILGIDHIVNTYNVIRNFNDIYPKGSFTIIPTVVDSGYDGPQSSFNNFNDLCSIARVKGFTISNRSEADYLISNYLIEPGFRIIALSQRLGKQEIIDDISPINIFGNGEIFQYRKGEDVTIVSSNFSYPQANKLSIFLEKNKIISSHFNISSGFIEDLSVIIKNASVTKKIILIDDSKSIQTAVEQVLPLLKNCTLEKIIILKRTLNENWLSPVSDIFEIDEENVLYNLTN